MKKKNKIIFKNSVYKFAKELEAILESFDPDGWDSNNDTEEYGIIASVSNDISSRYLSFDYFYGTLESLGKYNIVNNEIPQSVTENNDIITFNQFFKIVKECLFPNFPEFNVSTGHNHKYTCELHIPYKKINRFSSGPDSTIEITVKPSETNIKYTGFYLYKLHFGFVLDHPKSEYWIWKLQSVTISYPDEYTDQWPKNFIDTFQRIRWTLKNHGAAEKWTDMISPYENCGLFQAYHNEFDNYRTSYTMVYNQNGSVVGWDTDSTKNYYYAPYLWWKLLHLRIMDDNKLKISPNESFLRLFENSSEESWDNGNGDEDIFTSVSKNISLATLPSEKFFIYKIDKENSDNRTIYNIPVLSHHINRKMQQEYENLKIYIREINKYIPVERENYNGAKYRMCIPLPIYENFINNGYTEIHVYIDGLDKMTSGYKLFEFTKIVSCPDLNVPNMKNMSNMFTSCGHLKTVGHINMSSCEESHEMFQYCEELKEFSSTYAPKLAGCCEMFYYCSSLTSCPVFIDPENNRIRNQEPYYGLYGMFYKCDKLNMKDLKAWGIIGTYNLRVATPVNIKSAKN